MLGHHVLVDWYGITPVRLQDVPALTHCCLQAAQRCGLTPLGPPCVHRFPGGGVTAVLLLAESHLALHTFPERGFMALDIFTCGAAEATAALEVFRTALAPQHERLVTTVRGAELT